MMHDKVLFFSSKGTVYSLNVYDFPEGQRQAKGLPIVNVLPIAQDEKITAVVPVSEFSHNLNLIMLTKKGYIKIKEEKNENKRAFFTILEGMLTILGYYIKPTIVIVVIALMKKRISTLMKTEFSD